MPDKVDEILDQVRNEMKYVDEEFASPKIIDLQLKYVIATSLVSIRQQLFEISHYGIGTD